MRRTKFLLFSLIIVSAMSFSFADNWYILDSKENGFQIMFPEKPIEDVKIISNPFGQLKMNIFAFDASKKTNDDNIIYSINYTDFPDSLMNSNNTEKIDYYFSNAINFTLFTSRGKLLSEKNISIDSFPGREIKVERDDMYLYIRYYLVKNRLYTLITLCKKEKDLNKSILLFMDSFKLKIAPLASSPQ